MDSNKPVCYCKNVSESDIRKSVQNGNVTVADVVEDTGAAKHCGGCRCRIGDIVQDECRKK